MDVGVTGLPGNGGVMKPPDLADLETLARQAIDGGDSVLIDYYADQIDAWQRAHRPRVPSLAGAALWYAEHGLMVFPLQPGGKRPYSGTHGLKDGSTDPGQIRSWWSARPDSNIGLCTGHVVDVIDIDGPVGVKQWADHLARPNGLGEVIGIVNTPRAGGTHLYRPATGAGNGHMEGLDYRGIGGYVVAPPSVSPTGQRYRWTRALTVKGPDERI